ncbi:MAG: hypothetical protein E7613_06670 [Ruminococcaceae bacterium]|nr:hypothetical protein [Oscillospiraceae bacterium]
MLSKDKIRKYNAEVIARISAFMNYNSDFITSDIIDELVNECGIDRTYAFSLVLASACYMKIDEDVEDREMFEYYFSEMIHYVKKEDYENDPYYKNIKITPVKEKDWELREAVIKPYELIPLDDLKELPDGRIIPQVAFFDCEFPYPVILQGGVEWMLVTPNEVETMREDIEKAHGKVATYGLGLGYFPYMTSMMDSVDSVTVVEMDETVIDIFKRFILPQFPKGHKVRVVHADAFEYAEKVAPGEKFDYIYADTWHDPSDGVDMYLRFKALEHLCPGTEFTYWIEKTMKHYLPKEL